MSFATNNDMLLRFDARIIGDLVSDSGIRVNPATLANNAVLSALLDDAAGIIDAAVFVGQRYSATLLATLTGQDLNFLIRLNCNLAWGLLTRRRGQDVSQLTEYQEALAILEQLRDGERVFSLMGNEQAGNPQFGFPQLASYAGLNLIVDYAGRYFMNRRQQRPFLQN